MGQETGPLERDHERSVLREALVRARSGTGSTVLVEGPAGIGKTALLALAREEAAAAGTRVLAARGAPLEGDFAFGVVRQLLGPAVDGRGADDRRWLLDGPVAPARPLFDGTAGAGEDGYDVQHALTVLVGRIAASDGPLVLVVDDAHWADLPSLRFAVALAHRIDALGALLVLAARPPAEWTAPDLHLALAADPSVPVLRPRTLSAAAAVQLAGAATDPTFAAACHAASGGNPFYLRELLAAGADGDPAELGPEAVRRSVHARLRRLGADADAFARAASVLADATPPRTIAALAGLSLGDGLAAADALRAVGILDPGPAVAFAHPILRTVVAELQLSGERAAAHARAAALLQAEGAPAAVVAAQVLQAEPTGDAERVAVLRAAAGEASGSGAPDVAAVLLRRALAEPPAPHERAEVLVEAGLAEALSRDRQARPHLVEAIARATSPDDRLRAAVALWTSDSFDGRYDEGMEVLRRALDDAEGADPDRRLRVELEVARALRSAIATAEEGRARIAAVRAREWDPGDPTQRLALALVALDDLFAGRPADALAALAERALPPPGALRGAPTSQLLHIPFYVLVYCDRLTRARELLDALIADGEAHGARMGAEIGALWRALAHLRAGALPEAEADARRVVEGATQTRWRFGDVAARHFLAEALLERGAVDEARALTPAADAGPDLPPRGWTTHVRFGRARVALASGDAAWALQELLEVGRLEAAFAAERPTMLPWRSTAALAAGALGEGEQAARLAAEEVAVVRRIGAPRALGVALRAQGVVADDQAVLEEAVAVLAASDARLEHARALVDLGAARRRAGLRREARADLRAGLDGALACGALALAQRARDELAASGARLQRERATGVEALTGSELRVARLAAGGASNPEIAQALFVSRKTVEKHLASAYAKLGIGSREALGEALGARA